VKVDHPINADAVVQWLEKHPGGPIEVEVAALETISLVGTTQADAASKLAERLLAKRENAILIARRQLTGQVGAALRPQIIAALRRHAATSKNGDVSDVLRQLEKADR
jgi:hypothetical protein